MPSVCVETRRQYPPEQARDILEAVHGALVATFGVAPGRRNSRLLCHEPDHFLCPDDLSEPDRFTLVTIDAYSGRDGSSKRALYARIVENLSLLGIPPDHVLIQLRESAAENWGVRGGQAGSDVQ